MDTKNNETEVNVIVPSKLQNCELCGKPTPNLVWEPNIGKLVGLCLDCGDDKFERCSGCGELYYSSTHVC